MPTDTEAIEISLKRRLPSHTDASRTTLSAAYINGVKDHAIARTIGTGAVPSSLATERADLVAAVCRRATRLLETEEIGALLRITPQAASAIRKTLLAVYDDLPGLALRTAFEGAKRAGRGSKGAIEDGFLVRFASVERLVTGAQELERQGISTEWGEASKSVHELYIDSSFSLEEYFPEKK